MTHWHVWKSSRKENCQSLWLKSTDAKKQALFVLVNSCHMSDVGNWNLKLKQFRRRKLAVDPKWAGPGLETRRVAMHQDDVGFLYTILVIRSFLAIPEKKRALLIRVFLQPNTNRAGFNNELNFQRRKGRCGLTRKSRAIEIEILLYQKFYRLCPILR